MKKNKRTSNQTRERVNQPANYYVLSVVYYVRLLKLTTLLGSGKNDQAELKNKIKADTLNGLFLTRERGREPSDGEYRLLGQLHHELSILN